MKFGERVLAWLRGRNGMDALGHALFWIYILLLLVGMIVPNAVLRGLTLVIACYMLFRMLSKNLPARQAENIKYWNFRTKAANYFGKIVFFQKVGAAWRTLKVRAAKLSTKRFRTCPNCRAALCLPKRRGKHTAHCPRCGCDFSVRIIF